MKISPINKIIALLATFYISLCSAAQEPTTAGCEVPQPGSYAHSCQALKAESFYGSPHFGDKWIECEESGGTHGSAGYGMAIFFAEQGRPYWQEETAQYLALLEPILTTEERSKLKLEQAQWSNSLPSKILLAQSAGDEDVGGTLAMYMGELNALNVVRQRALELGCRLEHAKSSVPINPPSKF